MIDEKVEKFDVLNNTFVLCPFVPQTDGRIHNFGDKTESSLAFVRCTVRHTRDCSAFLMVSDIRVMLGI